MAANWGVLWIDGTLFPIILWVRMSFYEKFFWNAPKRETFKKFVPQRKFRQTLQFFNITYVDNLLITVDK